MAVFFFGFLLRKKQYRTLNESNKQKKEEIDQSKMHQSAIHISGHSARSVLFTNKFLYSLIILQFFFPFFQLCIISMKKKLGKQ